MVSIALFLSGCQPYPTPTPSLPAAAIVKSVEKLAEKAYRIELKGPATALDFSSWKTEVIAMCHGWLHPYFFSVDLEKVSEDSVWFICKALKMPKQSF
ncbi:MAG: hypothetical protein OXC41_01705 [Gammaproteobacteria bacterium]|nr:hypothetical protein [Gammaproteobacteria bacterium]